MCRIIGVMIKSFIFSIMSSNQDTEIMKKGKKYIIPFGGKFLTRTLDNNRHFQQ